jgi:uncharacterized protein YggE
MPKTIRDYDTMLKGALIMLCLITSFGILSLAFTYASSIEPSLNRTFAVAGEGKVTAKPDVASFSFSVFNQGENVSELNKTTSAKSKEVLDYLKSAGVPSKDIKSTENAVEPNFESYACANGVCPPSKVSGYTVRQSYNVKIRDFDIISEVLTAVAGFNVNSVSELSFVIDDREALEAEAREMAVESAREKAKEMARSGGFRIGKLISIYENNYGPVMPMYSMDKAEMGRAGGEVASTMLSPEEAVAEGSAMPQTVEPGTQEVIINVNMTFAIK